MTSGSGGRPAVAVADGPPWWRRTARRGGGEQRTGCRGTGLGGPGQSSPANWQTGPVAGRPGLAHVAQRRRNVVVCRLPPIERRMPIACSS